MACARRVRAVGARPSPAASSGPGASSKRGAPEGRIATRIREIVWAASVPCCIRCEHINAPSSTTARIWCVMYSLAVGTTITRRRFTRAEYYRMAEVGILREDDRVELIKGEIIEMAPSGPRHAAFVDNLTRLLIRRLPDAAIVRTPGPVTLTEDTEPQPDLTVLRRRVVPYKEREAWAED